MIKRDEVEGEKEEKEFRAKVIKELEDKLPKVARAIRNGEAKIDTEFYTTKRNKRVYQLIVAEKRNFLHKNRMRQRQNITIVTIDKETDEIEISVRG